MEVLEEEPGFKGAPNSFDKGDAPSPAKLAVTAEVAMFCLQLSTPIAHA